MTLGTIISSIILGLVLGVLARIILPGKQNIPLWLTVVVGIVAAYIGAWIARAIGVADTGGIDWIKFIIQLVLAVIGIGVVAGMFARKGVKG
ncbi:MAG: GlsB/YeaQ/YmgE family stress response membrane protein [Pseudonocardia sp.]|nr:GlsB/YeaQ/YmgE family stress response membrane protein [Pseudonocardia sp.]